MTGRLDAGRIDAYVEANRDRAVECLVAMLRIPSVTGEEAAAAEAVTRRLETIGMRVAVHEAAPGRPNLVGTWEGEGPGRTFLFSSHLDVFPPDPADPGRFGPWAGVVHEGKVYGRGACDMKGGACASIMALTFLKELGFTFRGRILSTWMSDEENGGALGVKWMVSQGLLKADCGICTEPTYGLVSNTHGGILRLRVTYEAPGQHAGQPYLHGMDALEKVHEVLTPVYALAKKVQERASPKYGSPCLSVTKIEAGGAPNVHPSACAFWIDRRLVPGETHEEALAQITDVLDAFKDRDEAFAYRLEVTSDRPILDIPDDDPHVAMLSAVADRFHGRKMPLYYMPGGSDAATLWKAYRYPVPNFGPGLLLEDCGVPDEKLDLAEYVRFVKIYMASVVCAFGGAL